MPYHAAKAVAATFCYDIRWALTPVFGNDFPSLCLPPKDPCFAKFLIDPAIVQYCTAETDRFRREGSTYKIFQADASAHIEAPNTHLDAPPSTANVVKQRWARPTDIESGYGTDTDRSDKYLFSPEVSPRTQFTPINRSQSPYSPRMIDVSPMSSPISTRATQGLLTPTSVPCEYQSEPLRTKRTHSKVAFHDQCDKTVSARPQTTATIDSAHGSETFISDEKHTPEDIEIAEMLLSLREREGAMPPTKRTRRGSD
jgi:hypothetical protein